MEIRYLSMAEQDLTEIFDYIAVDNNKAAERFLEKIDQEISPLEQYPEIGAIPRDGMLKSKGFRFLVIGNYLVFYKIQLDQIFIYRILHSKRDYNRIL